MATEIIAIHGGIGAGKSVVSRVLLVLGYEVYNCDLEARRLMEESSALKSALVSEFGQTVINSDGTVNRPALARIVFADTSKLEKLNRLVHGMVVGDVRRWAAERSAKVFVETALLYQSGLDRIVDEVWDVEAPREVRAQRAVERDNSTTSDIMMRIESQDSYVPQRRHERVRRIVNDGFTPLLPQILKALGRD